MTTSVGQRQRPGSQPGSVLPTPHEGAAWPPRKVQTSAVRDQPASQTRPSRRSPRGPLSPSRRSLSCGGWPCPCLRTPGHAPHPRPLCSLCQGLLSTVQRVPSASWESCRGSGLRTAAPSADTQTPRQLSVVWPCGKVPGDGPARAVSLKHPGPQTHRTNALPSLLGLGEGAAASCQCLAARTPAAAAGTLGP